MENRNNNLFQLNHKSNYYLMNNYNNHQEEDNTFNSDFVSMEDTIDYEKDDYFNNLQNSKKYSFNQKKGNSFK